MKYLIAIPCMDTIPTQFVKSLVGLRVEGTLEIAFSCNSLVYDSRNLLSKKAVENEFDRVLWLDSDVTFPADTFERLAKRLDMGYEFVSGLYQRRKEPIEPTIFKTLYMAEDKLPHADCYKDYPDGIFEIAACGFGCVMMTTSALKRVGEEFGLPFSPLLGFSEDLSFCMRAHQLGIQLWCDSDIKLGHIGYKEYTEADFRR